MSDTIKAIGFLELSSIAMGIETADAMLKEARVELYVSTPTCPGKYITLVYGDIAAVENALRVGNSIGGQYVINELVIAHIDEQIFPAITGTTVVDRVDAVGVIESLSMASLIEAADAATKEAEVQLIEVRLASGIGGKSFVTLTGDVADVKAAVASGVEQIKDSGNLIYFTVIPSPHPDIRTMLQ